ncbi:MAG: DNA double-strand break repair nuclease NurA [Aquificae bacterium]|nr:DNA double-strand break repair nuclease NurA [Aquificota bacterium]
MPLLGKYRFSFDTWRRIEPEEDFLEESQDIEDPDIETKDWKPIGGTPCDGISIAFVDGVRRTEHLVYIEDEYGGFSQGAFVSVGAGALFMKHGTVNLAQDSFKNLSVRRYLVVEGGVELEENSIKFPFEETTLEFLIEKAEGEISPFVNRIMADLESSVAQSVFKSCKPELMITDGTVHYSAKVKKLPFVGYVKKHRRLYIPSDRTHILRELKVGERTPIVKLHSQPTMEGEGAKSFDKFTWYVKISPAEGISGVARLEITAGIGLQKAKELANLTAYIIPKLASVEFSDKRAPQNLTPVKYLENALRRRLGSQTLIRRIITKHLTAPEAS